MLSRKKKFSKLMSKGACPWKQQQRVFITEQVGIWSFLFSLSKVTQ